MLVFGPIPSRRLGFSLGINNIPPKICSYACPYCQAGRTTQLQLKRTAFHDSQKICRAVERRLLALGRTGQEVDVLTFAPAGEPTLDVNLGDTIDVLRSFGYPIAVMTNGTLLWREDVQDDLCRADWVSIKVDAVWPSIWRRVNHSTDALSLTDVLKGAISFVRRFAGTLATETMLVHGVNDGDNHLAGLAEFVWRLAPSTAYLATPTRPPAKAWVRAPETDVLGRAERLFRKHLSDVEVLCGPEATEFTVAEDAVEELLGILAVHPMPREAARRVLQGHADAVSIEELESRGMIAGVEHAGQAFVVRSTQPMNGLN